MAYRLFLFILALGLSLALASAAWMIEARPFSAQREGLWHTVPTLGDFEATPYVKAYRAKHALAASTGRDTLSFHAARDDQGNRLVSSCTYSITGQISNAGWWTLSTHSKEDLPVASATEEPVSSLTALQDSSGALNVLVSQSPRPGNWLKAPPGIFTIVLNMYDAPFARDALNGRMEMPRITRIAC